MMGETVYNLEEFLQIVDKDKRLHYELAEEIKLLHGTIDRIQAVMRVYGLAKKEKNRKNDMIVVYEERKESSWNSKEIRELMNQRNINNFDRALLHWCRETLKELEEKARELKATPGNYFYFLG
jgi:ribosome assembly protein YihI (activator of Der GTPase)